MVTTNRLAETIPFAETLYWLCLRNSHLNNLVLTGRLKSSLIQPLTLKDNFNSDHLFSCSCIPSYEL